MDDTSDEKRLTTDADPPAEAVSAPASLIPSVLSRLASMQQEMHQAQIDQWITALNDSDWQVRATATRMLGELGEPEQRSELLLAALHDEDESVRARAVWALGKRGDHAPVERVVEALHDPAWHVREVAALTLGALGERAPVEPLIALFHNEEEDSLVREAAMMAIRQAPPEVLASPASEDAHPLQPQRQHPGETSARLHQPIISSQERFNTIADRWFGRREIDHNWQEEEDTVEIFDLDGVASSSHSIPQPVRAASTHHLGHPARRIATGVLAALLVAGIALSWLVLARTFHPASSRPSLALASPTISPSWTGHDLNATVADGVIYVGALNQAVYALRASDGTLLWRFNTSGPANDAPPLLVNGIVYVSATVLQDTGSQIGFVYALRASDGNLLWRFTRNNEVYPPVVGGGVAYVASGDGLISALRANDGSLLWRYTTSESVDGSPLLVNGTLYVSTRADASSDRGQGHLYALRVSDGSLLWRYTGQGPVYTPAMVDGIAYVSSEYGLAALRANDGSPLWHYSPAAIAFGSPVVSGGIVFATGTPLPPNATSNGGYLLQTIPMTEKMPFKMLNSTLYALRASDGGVLWRYKMSVGIFLSIIDGRVYLTTSVSQSQSDVYTLRASDGSLLWRFAMEDTPASIVIVGGAAYIGADGALYALRVSDGSPLWRTPMDGMVYNTPVLLGGRIYAGTTSGYVYALQANDGSSLWRYLTDVIQ